MEQKNTSDPPASIYLIPVVTLSLAEGIIETS